ncbi:iron complex transport system permease protein [Paenibacillus forsythiae]|uniref:Iron complex transport system permease protein n=1 Tax=Paenibacillus forsythiae TaxID=365616 RepID=A0ABU3HAT1_9BACL|nr:iron ABC transporter permease [Paenibacillus forsythiae]MDT3427924.1 iron complex transport system permease protein [Paenibacillus forsythiae]
MTATDAVTRRVFASYLFIGLLLAATGFIWSVSLGVTDLRWNDVLQGLLGGKETKEQLVISTIRVPRALVAALAGAALAVAGALMQAMTRNAFASPQIFGINAGASFFVVLFIVFFPGISSSALVFAAFAGAFMGGLLVFILGYSNDHRTPVQLALAGIAVSMLLSAMTEGFIVLYDNQTKNVLFWLAGAVHNGTWKDVHTVIPWSLTGMMIALLLSRSLTILSLGDDIARGLGQNILFIRLAVSCTVIMLAGSAVSIVGPIGFVGLIVPHIVRHWVGVDYRFILPLTAVFGSVLLLYADIVSRFISYPFESPVGIVTTGIGAPYLLYLLLRRRGRL